jgi:hypothetical protein
MPVTHFRSMEAPQYKNDVTSQFSDRNFVLAVRTCFLCNSDRIEVISDFRSLKNGENPFPIDGSIGQWKWRHHPISGYSLCRNFPGICCVQKFLFKNFMLLQQLRNSVNFGANMAPKYFANLDTSRSTFSRKFMSTEALWFRLLFPFKR